VNQFRVNHRHTECTEANIGFLSVISVTSLVDVVHETLPIGPPVCRD